MFGEGEDFLKRGFASLILSVWGDREKLWDKLTVIRGRRVEEDNSEAG